MAYAITNTAFFPPHAPLAAFVTSGADLATRQTINTTIAGLKWVKGRVLVKSGYTSAGTIQFMVYGGSGGTVSVPEILTTTLALSSNAAAATQLCFEFEGWSQNGFQSLALEPVVAGSALPTFDWFFYAA